MSELNDIKFIKGNGGMGRPAANEDPVSGVVFNGLGLTFDSASGNISGFEIVAVSGSDPVSYAKKFEYAEQMAECGIEYTEYKETALTSEQKAKNVLYYHISEFFRMNPTGTLYVMIKAGSTAVVPGDIADLQNYANGRMRQIGVFNSEYGTTLTATALQTVMTALEADHKPASLIICYSGKSVALSTLTAAELRVSGQFNLSVLIGCDFTPSMVNELGDYVYYGCLGACLGAVSKAKVNESIAWVQKFPLGFSSPALFNGNLIKNVSKSDKELLNNNYIFVITHVGDANNYFNDSHTLDLITSDYCYIEDVRTIDKAIRGIRSNLLPYLSSPLKVDAGTGKMLPYVVSTLENVANKALHAMEQAAELRGCSAVIDPEQDVITTGEVEIVIQQVPVGVMRKMKVKISYAKEV